MMKYLSFILVAVTIFALSSCDKEKNEVIEEPHVHEEEVITTVRLVITNNAGFNKTFSYKVDNGFNSSSPATPVIDDVVLDANTTYNVDVQVWNESETPAEDITEEVKEEGADHLFLLESSPSTGAGSIGFSNGSKDANGDALNQTLDFTTGDAGTGQLTVTLKHEPTDKSATDPPGAGGETDAQAIFPVTIQ